MTWKSLNQPLTLRSVFRAAGGIVVAAGLVFGAWQLLHWLGSASPSPRQIRASIHKYLKKKTGEHKRDPDYDFNLKQRVAALQTNVLSLKQALPALQTNIANLRKETATLRGELTRRQEEERTLKHRVRETETNLAERQRRLANRQQELSLAQTNVLRFESNLLALKQVTAELQSTGARLTNDLTALQASLAGLQTNSPAPQKEVSSARQAIAAKQQEVSSLRNKLKEQLAETAAREPRLASVRASLATAQTNLVTTQTNVFVLREDLSAKQTALAVKQKEVAARDANLTAKLKELGTLQAELGTKQRDLAAQQKDLASKEHLLANQLPLFSRELRKKAADANSYEILYGCIRQSLWLADRLLGSNEAGQQRSALPLAREAAEQALHQAEDGWLAARICEGYLWPNLDLADPGGSSRPNADNLLQACQNIFQHADEPQNVIRNYRLRLKYVTNDRQLESVRYNLAYALEQAGEFKEASTLYRQVTDTNYARYAEQRLAVMEQKLQQKRTAAR